jgi:subtilisin family serine protease
MPIDTRTPSRRPQSGRRALALLAVAALTAVAIAAAALPVSAQIGVIRNAGAPDAIKDRYVVVLKDGPTIDATVGALAAQYGATVGFTYRQVLPGFSATMPAARAEQLAGDPRGAYVEQDTEMEIATDQADPPSWGLDRIDQRSLPTNANYNYDVTASSVRAYIMDTGIRITHDDFGTRASYGRDLINDDDEASDCNGHGTKMAGVVGGTEHGVAKSVRLIAVKIANCQGKSAVSFYVAGMDWVSTHHIKPAVANMSLARDGSDAIDDAVAGLVADGVTLVVAAGNNSADACQKSPARAPEAITVGATDSSDARASYSNFGSCLDIFAPGSSITTTDSDADDDTTTGSGTSMAAPHVTGAAALYLAKRPGATPAQVRNQLVTNSTKNKVTVPGTGSPNRLVYRVRGVVVSTSDCDSANSRFECTVGSAGGVAPIAIRWYLNGSQVPAWNDRTFVMSSCAAGSTVTVRMVVSDALGGSTDEATHSILCRSAG